MIYNDSDQNWDWTDTNYMLGTFTVDSEKYTKYVAGLAQKMAKKEKTESAEKKQFFWWWVDVCLAKASQRGLARSQRSGVA
jgi:hypothetical protein